MIEVLNIHEWIKFEDVQFKTIDNSEINGGTRCVIRLKDNKKLYVNQDVYFANNRFCVWYFHPDMKTVEIYDMDKKIFFMIEINKLYF